MTGEDLLEEHISFNTGTQKILLQTVRWSRVCGIAGLVISSFLLIFWIDIRQSYSVFTFENLIEVIESLLLLFTSIFLLLFASRLKTTMRSARNLFAVALKRLQVAMYLFILLITVFIGYYFVWGYLKIYVLTNAG